MLVSERGNARERRLIKQFRALDATGRETLEAFAEFLVQRSAQSPSSVGLARKDAFPERPGSPAGSEQPRSRQPCPDHSDPSTSGPELLGPELLGPEQSGSRPSGSEILVQGIPAREAETPAAHGVSDSPAREPRPAGESVVGAMKRLRRCYPQLDATALLDQASLLMSAHMLQGRPASEVIDELEVLFARHAGERG